MLDSSSSALGSDNLLDVDGLDKIHVRLKLTDVIMLVCGTVAGTVTLCILVSFMSCCCKKKRKQSEQSDSETNGNTKYNTSDKQKEGKQGPDILEVAVETRQRGGNGEEQDRSEQKGSIKSHKSNDKFSSLTRQQKVISVKDRIRVFETKPQPDSSKSEDSKPKRKKPKSKAFEDFENSGILIGFGNAPRKRTEAEQDGDTEGEEDGENVSQSGSEDHRVALPYLQSSTDRSLDSDSIRADSDSGNIHNYSFFREDDEGIHTMDSDDDEFDRVTRDTEILKSFRKPPPPKNRGRVKRSFKKEGHHPIHSGASRQMTNMDESDESASDRNTPVSQILKNVGEPARLSPSPLTFQQSSFLESDQNQVKSHKSKQLSSNSTNSSPMLPRDLTNEGNENAVLLPKTQTGKHKLLITADSNTPDGSTAKQRHTVFDVNLHKRAKQIGPATRPHSYHDELDTPNERTRLYGQNSSSEITEQINDQPNLSPTDMRRSKSDYTTFPSSSAQISVATIRDLTQNREKETSDPRAQAYTNYAYEPVMYPNSEKLERKNISKKKTESSKDGE